jgi:aquaporin Z
MNPVRSLSPALIGGKLDYLWIYLIAPFVGAFLALAFLNYFFPSTHKKQID